MTRRIVENIIPAMHTPPVQFVKTSDGYDIAYAVAGEGFPFVFFPNMFSNAQIYWTANTFIQPWWQGLASRYRTVVVDGRGQGMSSRGLRENQTIESLTRDLEAVVARLGIESFVLMAQTHSAHLAVQYALKNPQKVSALVLDCCSILADAWPMSLYQVLPGEHWQAFLISQMPPGMGRERVLDILSRLEDNLTAGDFLSRMQAYRGSDVTDALSRLSVPTLVIHPRELMLLRPDESMKVAARIPNARFVMIEGDASPGDALSGLTAIDEFLLTVARQHNKFDVQASDQLSTREIEVLRLIAAGCSNAQIAEALVISPNTVGRHVSNIFDKIGAANRVEATVYARDNGLA